MVSPVAGHGSSPLALLSQKGTLFVSLAGCSRPGHVPTPGTWGWEYSFNRSLCTWLSRWNEGLGHGAGP
jgi:hypothetical protein